jgi:endonuclease/exonuclease/phosphatase family metal-dependent hydrolase
MFCKPVLLIGAVVLSISLFAQKGGIATPDALNIVTWNMRLDTPSDGPNAWPNRKDVFLKVLKEEAPAIFGLQEALYNQLQDVEKAFPGFKRVGVGREDGRTKGEFAPVFFDTLMFKTVSSSTFWLSQTPNVPGSMGWDAACTRIVTWTQLVLKTDGKKFFVFNTHFDHMGQVARRNSVHMLLHAVDSIAGTSPAIITGDFNAGPDSEPYGILTDNNNPLHFSNAFYLAEQADTPFYTYTGFKVGGIPGENIDYVFLKNIHKVLKYRVNTFHTGDYYPSDHLPVRAVIEF